MSKNGTAVKSSDNKLIMKAKINMVLLAVVFGGLVYYLPLVIDVLAGSNFFWDYRPQLRIIGLSIAVLATIVQFITFKKDKYIEYAARVEEWKKKANVKDLKEWRKSQRKAAKTKEWNRQLVNIESMGWAGLITIMIAIVVFLGIRLADRFGVWKAPDSFLPFQLEVKYLILGCMAIIYFVHRIFFNKKEKETQKSVDK